MIKELQAYKENPSNNKELGDWSEQVNEHDPFRDGKGGERIGLYVNWLQDGFNKGLKKDECLNHANKMYVKNWGEDKIIYSNSR